MFWWSCVWAFFFFFSELPETGHKVWLLSYGLGCSTPASLSELGCGVVRGAPSCRVENVSIDSGTRGS